MPIPDAVRTLDRDLRELFGSRLQSVIAYGAADGTSGASTSTLAIVDSLTAEDLRACAARVAAWQDAGLATPLLLAAHEFGRSLDAFPFEFGAILADHALVSGANPFKGLRIEPADLRRACEIQARSHLLHVREGYMETRGRGDAIAELVVRSAAPLAALVKSVSRLQGVAADDAETAARHIETALGVAPGSVTNIVKLRTGSTVSPDEARRLFPGYLDTVERLTRYIDQWPAG